MNNEIETCQIGPYVFAVVRAENYVQYDCGPVDEDSTYCVLICGASSGKSTYRNYVNDVRTD